MDKFNRCAFLAAGLLSAVLVSAVNANPNNPNVVSGQVSFDTSQAGVLNVTNSPNAIINWQGFSIPAGEITRFIQQSADSAVLNRVIGQDPSVILGQLLSNGQVFLINPNGVIFGQGSMVDTAGLLASTLNISNEDFLRGNYLFVNPGPGKIENFGVIHVTNGGSVVLLSPNIENNGLIQSDGGHLVLAAGERLTLTSMDAPQVRFEIQAPSDKVINIGQLMANGGGSVDIFAASIQSSGTINADSVQVDQHGRINLVAQGDVTLDAQSQISAKGADGGSVLVQSKAGTTRLAGTVDTTGVNAKGGKVELLGHNVGLFDKARVDASGKTAGGSVHIGGDRQGGGDSQTADFTYISPLAQVHADAIKTGKGGSIITYANDVARIYGHLSARGGALSGDGGFIETSGKKGFEILLAPDVGAANGLAGEWLIDPDNIAIVTGTSNITPLSASTAFTSTTGSATIAASLIEASLDGGSTVTITTGNNSGQAGDIDWNTTLNLNNTTSASATLSLQAANNINFNTGGISNGASKSLNLELWADTDGANGGQVNYYNANLDLGNGWLHILQGATRSDGAFSLLNTAPITINAAGGLTASSIDTRNVLPATINASSGISADSLVVYGGILTKGVVGSPQQFANPLALNGPVTLNKLSLRGQLNSNSAITVNGAFDWYHGVIGGTGATLVTNGTTTINDSLVETVGSREWTNNGIINWSGSDISGINLWGTTSLQNKNIMNISVANGLLGGNSGEGLENTHAGVINVTGNTDFMAAFTNNGTVNISKGGLDIPQSGTDAGTYNLSNNGYLWFSDLNGRYLRRFIGTITDTDLTGEVWFNNGEFDISNGLNAGWVDISDSATVKVTGDYNSNWGTQIAGVLNVGNAYTQLAGGETFMDYGKLLAASVTVQSGTSSFPFANSSSLSSAGSLVGAGIVDLNGYPFTNSGNVALWGGPMTILGDYQQTSSGVLAVALSSPVSFGFMDGITDLKNIPGTLAVRGTASVAGNLFVLLGPLAESYYTVIDTTLGLKGVFNTVSHQPTDDNLNYKYDDTSFTVTGIVPTVLDTTTLDIATLDTSTHNTTEVKDALVTSNVARVDEVFDKSTDNILATVSSTNSDGGTAKGGGNEPIAPKACKK